MSENEGLTTKQYAFIYCLLVPMTIVDAAKKTGISEATATRWMNDPSVKKVLQATQADLFEHGMSALKSRFTKAVITLDRNMDADQAADQIRSAKTVIEQVIASQKLTDKIAKLEAQLAEQQQDQMYKVVFDLRQLNKAERELLEAIEEARSQREGTKE